MKTNKWFWLVILGIVLVLVSGCQEHVVVDPPVVLTCGKLVRGGNVSINCTLLIICPDKYNNTIYYGEIHADEIRFVFYNQTLPMFGERYP
jgi:hypothetical protein